MPRYILFYGEQQYGEYDSYREMGEQVDGSTLIDGYIYSRQDLKWYQWHVAGSLPLDDIPTVLRTMMLLME